MNNYYVYVYQDLSKPCKIDTKELGICFLYEPFYIGKGKNNRILYHMRKYKLKNSHLHKRIFKIKESGLDPHIQKIFDNLSEPESLEIEKKLILKIGKRNNKTGTLCNISDGGEGTCGVGGELHPNWGKSRSQETRNKISERLKVNNPMHRKEVSESVRLKNIGRTPWNKGKKTDESVKKKLSEKKLKYFDIELTHKITGKKFNFNNVFEVMGFLQRSHRSILNYLIKNESQEYYITYNKINN